MADTPSLPPSLATASGEPVYIGSPRSGTTALGDALGEHSELSTQPESDLLYYLFERSWAELAYIADPLTVHRRPNGGVTASLDKERHLHEVRRIHDVARSRLALHSELEHRMVEYEIIMLAEQFGLTNSTTTSDAP